MVQVEAAASCQALCKALTVDGVRYGPMEARMEGPQNASNAWLVVSLKEGKNREIRKVMAHLGLQVSRLIRTAYGPFQLGYLPPGSAVEVAPNILKEKLAWLFRSSRGLQCIKMNIPEWLEPKCRLRTRRTSMKCFMARVGALAVLMGLSLQATGWTQNDQSQESRPSLTQPKPPEAAKDAKPVPTPEDNVYQAIYDARAAVNCSK